MYTSASVKTFNKMKKLLFLLLLVHSASAQFIGQPRRGAPPAVVGAILERANIGTPFLSLSEFRSGKAVGARAIFINEQKKSGVFIIDSADTSTPDDSVMVLVRDGARYKRVYNKGIVLLDWFSDNSGGAKVVFDAAINSGSSTVTSATANFNPSMVGQYAMIRGGLASKPLVAKIATYISPTQITLTKTATGSVSNVELTYGGYDETPYIQKAVNFLIANRGGVLETGTGARWADWDVFVNPATNIPITIRGPTTNNYTGGYGTFASGSTFLRSRPGAIFSVNLTREGNSFISPGSQYMGFSIENISFVGKSDSVGMVAVKTFRTRGTYRNLFMSRMDYLVNQSDTDASGNLNYCDMSLYENIRISASLYSGLLLSRADGTTISDFRFEGQMGTAKYGIEIAGGKGINLFNLIHWGGGGGSVYIAGGSFVKLNVCQGVNIFGFMVEDSKNETEFDFSNSEAINVSGIVDHLAVRDMFRLNFVKGLKIDGWYSYSEKSTFYDVNVISSYSSNRDISWSNTEFYDHSQPAGTVFRTMVVNNPMNIGFNSSAILNRKVTSLDFIPGGFSFFRTGAGASALPPNASYAVGIQWLMNEDISSRFLLMSDGFKLLKRYMSGGTWNANTFAIMDQQNMNTVTNVTDGGSVTLSSEFGYFYEYRWTLGANRTIPAPSLPTNGQRITFVLTQDATGGRTVTWNSVYSFPNNIAPTLSTSAGAYDVIEFGYNSTKVKWELKRYLKYDSYTGN